MKQSLLRGPEGWALHASTTLELQPECFWVLFSLGFLRGAADSCLQRRPERGLESTQCAKLCLLKVALKLEPAPPPLLLLVVGSDLHSPAGGGFAFDTKTPLFLY